MANAGRRTINYTPRMTDFEALEELPHEIKEALCQAVNDWNAYAILRQYRKDVDRVGRKQAIRLTVKLIRQWDKSHIAKGWIRGRGRRKKVLGPPIRPLYSNWRLDSAE